MALHGDLELVVPDMDPVYDHVVIPAFQHWIGRDEIVRPGLAVSGDE